MARRWRAGSSPRVRERTEQCCPHPEYISQRPRNSPRDARGQPSLGLRAPIDRWAAATAPLTATSMASMVSVVLTEDPEDLRKKRREQWWGAYNDTKWYVIEPMAFWKAACVAASPRRLQRRRRTGGRHRRDNLAGLTAALLYYSSCSPSTSRSRSRFSTSENSSGSTGISWSGSRSIYS